MERTHEVARNGICDLGGGIWRVLITDGNGGLWRARDHATVAARCTVQHIAEKAGGARSVGWWRVKGGWGKKEW
jgi:hypothetical protein